jgi:hypothetical protein
MYEEFEPGYDWEDLIEKNIKKDIDDDGRPFYDDDLDSGLLDEQWDAYNSK